MPILYIVDLPTQSALLCTEQREVYNLALPIQAGQAQDILYDPGTEFLYIEDGVQYYQVQDYLA